MLIDLSELLSHEDKEIRLSYSLEMEEFTAGKMTYPVSAIKPIELLFKGLGKKKILIESDMNIMLNIPCDRCLEEVEVELNIKTSKETDLDDRNVDEDEKEEYLSGTSFDVEKFVYGEILVNLPMKTVCSEDCKGFCNRCGTNLNHGECGCDTTELDPRMAKALEVFNSFKEV